MKGEIWYIYIGVNNEAEYSGLEYLNFARIKFFDRVSELNTIDPDRF